MAGGLQPTVSPSNEPPTSAPTAFTSFRREKRELGIGPPEHGRMEPGRVLRGQYIAARASFGSDARCPARRPVDLLFDPLRDLAGFLLYFAEEIFLLALGRQLRVVRDLSRFLFYLTF